ncbi:MAG: O-antigen ligase family protein [Candidatus Omnitrophica bacterium]|jgi:O-antigen ligase|nr:O-antigen ligase family protein [Candidatus Omnitrophota bacterium]
MPKKILWIIVMAVAFLLPFFSSDAFKTQTYTLYALFAAGLFGIAAVNRSWLNNKALILPLSLWLFVVFFTSFYALYRPGAFTGMCNMLFYAFVFITVAGIEDKMKKQLAFMLVIGSILISARAIFQYFVFFEKIAPLIQERALGLSEKEALYITDIALRQRTISTFVTPNLLASYLSMVNLIALFFCFVVKSKAFRGACLLALLMNCYSLWLTRSAAGLVSFAIGVFLLNLLMSAKGAPREKRFRITLAVFCAVVFAAMACLTTSRIIYDTGTDKMLLSLAGRLEFWKTAMRIITDQPFQFVGLEGFGFLYRLYAPYAQFESTMAHNLFLQLWIETGIMGMAVFIWFAASVVLAAIRGLKKARPVFEDYAFKSACLGAVFVFLIHNMLDFSFFVPQTAVIFWLLCAFIVSNENGRQKSDRGECLKPGPEAGI